MRWRLERLGIAAGMILFAMWASVLARPLIWFPGTHLYGPVDSWLNLSTLEYWTSLLIQGAFEGRGIWDGATLFPEPYGIGLTDTLLGVLPIYALYRALTENVILGYNLTLLTALLLNFISLIWFFKQRGFAHASALFGAWVFAGSPLITSHLGHIQLLAWWWFPLSCAALYRFLEGGKARHLVLCGTCLALQTASSVYIGIYLGTALTTIILLKQGWNALLQFVRRKPAACLGIAVYLMLILAVVLAPHILASRHFGATRSLQENINFSANLRSYLSVAGNNWLYGGQPFFHQNLPEKELFLGFVPLLMICVAVVLLLRHRERVSFAPEMLCLFVLACFAALGPKIESRRLGIDFTLPYGFLYDYLPFLQAMRVPARWGFLALFACACLNTYAFDYLRKKLPAVVIAVLCAFLAMEQFTRPLLLAAAAVSAEDRRLVHAINQYTAPQAGTLFWPVLAIGSRSIMERNLGQLRDAKRGLLAVIARRSIANGYTGITPASYRDLVIQGRSLGKKRFVDFLLRRGIQSLVIVRKLLTKRDKNIFRRSMMQIRYRSKDYLLVQLIERGDKKHRTQSGRLKYDISQRQGQQSLAISDSPRSGD